MPNPYYDFTPPFIPGTKVRSDAANTQFQAIETAFDLLPASVGALALGTATFCGATAGAGNAYTAVAPTTRMSYASGDEVVFIAHIANTGPATLNVDGVGAQSIVRPDGAALAANDFLAGVTYAARYDLANSRWQLMVPATSYLVAVQASASAASASATAASGSATAASGSATAASGSATAASGSATSASGSATSASDSATLASQWAVHPEDDDIPGFPGQFSALHWAQKALVSVTGVTAVTAGTNITITGTAAAPVVNLVALVTGISVNGVTLSTVAGATSYLSGNGTYGQIGLTNLSDVTLTAPANNQTLYRTGGIWVNTDRIEILAAAVEFESSPTAATGMRLGVRDTHVRVGDRTDTNTAKIEFWDGDDFQTQNGAIGHYSSAAELQVRSGPGTGIVSLRNQAGTVTMARFTQNAASELMHNNITRIATTSTGVTHTGNQYLINPGVDGNAHIQANNTIGGIRMTAEVTTGHGRISQMTGNAGLGTFEDTWMFFTRNGSVAMFFNNVEVARTADSTGNHPMELRDAGGVFNPLTSPRVAEKSGNTNRSSTIVMTADPNLTLSLSAGNYIVDVWLIFQAANAAMDCRVGLAWSGAVNDSRGYLAFGKDTAGATVIYDGQFNASPTAGLTFQVLSSTVEGNMIRITGAFDANGSGTLDLHWAQAVSDAGALSLLKNSRMEARLVSL